MLTIPFKYRFGYKRGAVVADDVSAGFNIGLYGGYKLTRYSVVNKAGTYLNKTSFSVRTGPFLSFSAATLDSVATTAGKTPKTKEKINIAVLPTSPGLMLDFEVCR